jgi:hypothetical protein
MMASLSPGPVLTALADYDQQAHEIEGAQAARGWIGKAREALPPLNQAVSELFALIRATPRDDLLLERKDLEVEQKQEALADLLMQIQVELDVIVPSRLEPAVQVDFRRRLWHPESEYEGQLQAQQRGLNRLTVGEWLHNRLLFEVQGHDPDSAQAQRDVRVAIRA